MQYRAFFYLLEIEMKDYDSFVHKSNKALKVCAMRGD